MRVLTYVDGLLTVIKEDAFFSGIYEKPVFIKGLSFYYEPTLKVVDGRELSMDEMRDAETYISNFMFHVEPIVSNVFCVNADGEYLGHKPIEDGEFEVPTKKPTDEPFVIWNFEIKEWIDTVCVDKHTGLYLGKWFKSAFQNSVYVRSSLVNTNFCMESQTYNFETKVFDIDIEVVRKKKLAKINFAFTQAINEAIGFVGFGEMSSWDKQETEARAWVIDNNAITPFIDALLVGRSMNETKDVLVQKIIVKADSYKTFYGQMLGKLHAKQKLIEEAETLEILKAIEG